MAMWSGLTGPIPEEFYEVTEGSFEIDELRAELLDWEQTYNAIRPHQALGYLTPSEFL